MKKKIKSIIWIVLAILFFLGLVLIPDQIKKYQIRKCVEWRITSLAYPDFRMTEKQKALCDKYPFIFNEEWKDFHSEIGQFKASFPIYPEHKTYNVPLFDTGLVERLDEYIAEKADGTIFTIFVGTYPPAIDTSKPEFGLEAGVNNAVESLRDNELISSQFTTLNEYEAIDYLIHNKEFDIYIKGKMFMKGQTRYQLLYTYGSRNYKESDCNQFINSFQILK